MPEKIYIPFELFRKLSVEESDKLQEKLMNIYYNENPEKLNEIIERAKGDTDLVEVYKEEEFSKILNTEYAYDINILKHRENDPLSDELVRAVNEYNLTITEEPIDERL